MVTFTFHISANMNTEMPSISIFLIMWPGVSAIYRSCLFPLTKSALISHNAFKSVEIHQSLRKLIYMLSKYLTSSDISFRNDRHTHSLLRVLKCSHLSHLLSRCENNAASVCLLCESSVLGKDPVGWPWLSLALTLDSSPGWM